MPADAASVLVRRAAAVTLLGTALIHASVAREHFDAWPTEGVFFVLLANVEGMLAAAVAARPSARALRLAVGTGLATAALLGLSRTIGVPVGPHAWQPEAVGRVDVMATLLELTTAAVLAPLVGWARRGPALLGATALVLVVGTGATVFALAPAGAISAGHDHGLPDTPLRVAAPSPTGEVTVAEGGRARRCAMRAMPGASAAGPARTRVTLVARDFCFGRQAFAIPAG